MSNLILSTEDVHTVRLDVRVEDSEWKGLYDRIEVHRSVLGEAGPYREITANGWLGAYLPVGAKTTASVSPGKAAPLSGTTLELLIDGTQDVTVTFPGGTNHHQDAANAIASQVSPLLLSAYVNTDGQLVLVTASLGARSRLSIVGGTGAALLGLYPGAEAVGQDPQPVLVAGQQSYRVTDFYSKSNYYYKTRFLNSSTGVHSDFSPAFTSSKVVGINPNHIVRGFVRLIQRDGRPDARKEVTIFAPVLGFQIDGATLTGGQEVFLTDATGYVEVCLLRGCEVDVGIGGTSLIRRVKVPTDPTIELFDLLSPAFGSDDTFAVQRTDRPYAERRNL